MDKKTLEYIAHAGYAARGVLYVIIGTFAVLAARGSQAPKDSKGALETILGQPFGQILILIMIASLFGYAFWRLLQSVADADDHGTSAKGLAVRTGLFGSAVTHTLLAIFAISLIVGGGGDGGNEGSRDWLAKMVGQSWGPYALAAIAAIVAIVGGAHIWKGWTAGFEKWFEGVSSSVMAWLRPLCRIGLIARGIVFLIVAGLIAYQIVWLSANDVDRAPGLKETLQTVQDQPYGWIILGIIGAGLLAFALYSLSEAVYRRISFGI